MDALPLVKRQELAKFFGVTPRTIDNWVERGCPVAERFLKSRNVRGFQIEDVANWRFESTASNPMEPEEAYSLILKVELNAMAQDVAKRIPRLMDALKADHDHAPEAVEYGARLAIGMLALVINARTEDANVYFGPFPSDS